MCICVWEVCACVSASVYGIQKGASDLPEAVLPTAVSHLMWVPEQGMLLTTERAISPSP